ncbi:hypothetical protein LY90DRAFT_699185 [Neocallimastix californiae]|jgi:hypothetical protein|uniref:Uncharacterized protein n=1 Tax=Neocallimastix californiae TaxID=1754190 RepID=A0A1Y2ETT6_9FUNG|nr:hypothetical protein LY90DRAFT_699185 [Neocallimastix californiae]|eukprot:ORY74980.1 hypothetical protein LY90DRAFT_699185 [Neocallimastix californiae]
MADIINATFSEKECEDLSKMLKLFKAKNYSKTFICCSVKNVFPKTKTFKANAFENSLCLLKENLVEKYGPNFLNKFENGADISDIWEHGIEDVPVKMLYDENDVTENEIGEKKVDFIMSFRESESIFGDLTVEVKLITMVNLFSSYDLDYDNMINKLDSYISGNQKCENKEVKVENLGLLEDEIKVSLNINSERNNMKYNYMYMLVFVVNRRIMALSELFSTITLKQFIRRVNRKNNQSSLYLKCLLNEGKYKRFFNYMNIIYDEDYSFNSEFKYEIHIKKVSDMPLMFDENDYNINENTWDIKEVLQNLKKLIGSLNNEKNDLEMVEESKEENYYVNKNSSDESKDIGFGEVIKNKEEVFTKIDYMRYNSISTMNTEKEPNVIDDSMFSSSTGIEYNIGIDPINSTNTGISNMEIDTIYSSNNEIQSIMGVNPIYPTNTGVQSDIGINPIFSTNDEMQYNIGINSIFSSNDEMQYNIGINPIFLTNNEMQYNIGINPIFSSNDGIQYNIGINPFCLTNTELESNVRVDPIYSSNTEMEYNMGIDQLRTVESIDLSNYDIPLSDLELSYYLNNYPTGFEGNL